MKITLFLALFIQLSVCLFGQRPSVELWDKRFGGAGEDGESVFQQTRDGGYIIGGTSNSGVDGDKTQSNWDNTGATEDYWVVKINSVGEKQWDKRFGGSGIEVLFALQQTFDGGYILGGMTGSTNDGDISQPPFGGWDYWLVKTDSLGNVQWNQRYGGTSDDMPNFVLQTPDSGYLLVGASASPISGDKTQDSYGSSFDGWVIKTDALGHKQWDKRFGGLNDDYFNWAVSTKDGGYLLAGSTASDSGLDISQTARGSEDYWIIKIDSVGNRQWDKRYGGGANNELISILSSNSGGYLLGGFSGSDSSDDKTTNDGPFWIIKTDSIGNVQWDRGYGLANSFSNVVQTLDGGYLLSGTSTFNIVDDKTENNLGNSQIWMVKTDSSGLKQWDKTILTYRANFGSAIQTFDSCYVVGGGTNAGVGGYKTQPNRDITDSTVDFWISKYCFSGTPEAFNDLTVKIQLSIYPNPFRNELDIRITQQNLHQATFTISNLLGQTIYIQSETNLSPSYTKMLDLNYLANGVYWVSVVVDGERVTKEVIKSGP